MPEIEALLARRRKTGVDRRDEVWDAVLHLVPATDLRHAQIAQQLALLLHEPAREAGLVLVMQEFNLGESIDDYRIPDGGIFVPGTSGVWIPTAKMVIEVVSPGDESWEKLPYFAKRSVDEVLIVEPSTHRVHWLMRHDDRYEATVRSGLLDLAPDELAALLDWH
ncbi:MAG: Uma2 family endonuclease [Acidobacteriota bacterium]|nr:Uma2 family endonuclease [Acidobacteriota bacterium]